MYLALWDFFRKRNSQKTSVCLRARKVAFFWHENENLKGGSTYEAQIMKGIQHLHYLNQFFQNLTEDNTFSKLLLLLKKPFSPKKCWCDTNKKFFSPKKCWCDTKSVSQLTARRQPWKWWRRCWIPFIICAYIDEKALLITFEKRGSDRSKA